MNKAVFVVSSRPISFVFHCVGIVTAMQIMLDKIKSQ